MYDTFSAPNGTNILSPTYFSDSGDQWTTVGSRTRDIIVNNGVATVPVLGGYPRAAVPDMPFVQISADIFWRNTSDQPTLVWHWDADRFGRVYGGGSVGVGHGIAVDDGGSGAYDLVYMVDGQIQSTLLALSAPPTDITLSVVVVEDQAAWSVTGDHVGSGVIPSTSPGLNTYAGFALTDSTFELSSLDSYIDNVTIVSSINTAWTQFNKTYELQ